MLYVFVEGLTDELFVKTVFDGIILEVYENYKIVQYSRMEKDKFKNYIKAVNSIGYDYIVITDSDGKKNKKDLFLKIYSFINSECLFLSIYEIESWIIAGLKESTSKKLKIKQVRGDTSSITKEKFYSMKSDKMEETEFVMSILSDFDINQAIKRNSSLNIFYSYFST